MSDVAPPRGPFNVRVCAGCGEQINDGHHGHGGKLAPTYDVPVVLVSALDELLDEEPYAAPHASGGVVLGPFGRIRALRSRLVIDANRLRTRAGLAEGALCRIAVRRPSHAKAAAAFHRSREDAREALRAIDVLDAAP